jgi:hypothetical protein
MNNQDIQALMGMMRPPQPSQNEQMLQSLHAIYNMQLQGELAKAGNDPKKQAQAWENHTRRLFTTEGKGVGSMNPALQTQ